MLFRSWSLPVEMEFMAKIGGVPQADMERTWNAGIGMVAIVSADAAGLALASLAARGMKAWVAGVVEPSGNNETRRSYLVSDFRR